MNDEWHYVQGEVQYGPVSFAELSRLAASGQLASTDPVWRPGMADWVAARNVPELSFPAAKPRSAPASLVEPLDEAPGGSIGEVFSVHLRRAFSWNLAGAPITESEEQTLTQLGITSPGAQSYLCWRRSLLWVIALPTLLAAVLYVIRLLSTEAEFTGFGILILILDVLAHFALPVAVVLGACFWTRPRLSTQLVTWTWLVAFLFPMVQALFPLDWLVDFGEIDDAGGGEAARAFVGIMAGFAYYLNLMPIVLSVIPGIIRACLRIKTLLPKSMLSGWFLIGATPLYGLLFLVTFIMFNQMVGNAVLFLAMLFFLGAPLVYLARTSLFACPMTTPEHKNSIIQLQTIQLISVSVGIILLLVYLFTKEILGKALVGFSSEDSLIQVWDVLRFGVEFLGRSLFITVVVAHYLLKATIIAGQGEQQMREGIDERAYQQNLDEIGDQLELGGSAARGRDIRSRSELK